MDQDPGRRQDTAHLRPCHSRQRFLGQSQQRRMDLRQGSHDRRRKVQVPRSDRRQQLSQHQRLLRGRHTDQQRMGSLHHPRGGYHGPPGSSFLRPRQLPRRGRPHECAQPVLELGRRLFLVSGNLLGKCVYSGASGVLFGPQLALRYRVACASGCRFPPRP